MNHTTRTKEVDQLIELSNEFQDKLDNIDEQYEQDKPDEISFLEIFIYRLILR